MTTATLPGSGNFASDLIDDGYSKGDDVRPNDEPGNGAIVLARYRSYGDSRDEYEIVWRREDRKDGQETGDWFQISTPSAYCKTCRTTRQFGSTGPDSWGVVLGEDDPEPYGLAQIVLWPGGKNALWW